LKHANVAIFVPHNGCPHACSFCNQRKITGQSVQPTAEDVKAAVSIAQKSLGSQSGTAEIAFFGGSFTAIQRDYMLELLSAAKPYVANGSFSGIRISTRPDAVDQEILHILKEYGVTAIELGAQSMSEEVLRLNRRGHTAEDVRNAAGRIKAEGFSLGLQMMTGLYGSDDSKDRETAEALAALSPDTMRIYPTVVLRDTGLYELLKKGLYHPPGLEEAVQLCAELLLFFEARNIRVIRMGLHDSESLRENMAAGVFHPAFRELCEGEIMYRNARSALAEKNIQSGMVEFTVHPASVSRFAGQRRKNLIRLQSMGLTPRIRQNQNFSKFQVEAERAAGATPAIRQLREQERRGKRN